MQSDSDQLYSTFHIFIQISELMEDPPGKTIRRTPEQFQLIYLVIAPRKRAWYEDKTPKLRGKHFIALRPRFHQRWKGVLQPTVTIWKNPDNSKIKYLDSNYLDLIEFNSRAVIHFTQPPYSVDGSSATWFITSFWCVVVSNWTRKTRWGKG